MTGAAPPPSWWLVPPAAPAVRNPEMADDVTDTIRAILREHGRLAVDVGALEDHSDLYEAGLTSYASVNLMLALEEHFDVEFSDRMLSRAAFSSIAAIRSGLDALIGA